METGNVCQQFWYRNPSGKRRQFASSYSSFEPSSYKREPCDDCNSIRQCLNNELVRNFDINQMQSVETTHRNSLPTRETIKAEKDLLRAERVRSAWNRRSSESDYDGDEETKTVASGEVTTTRSSSASGH